MALGLVVEALRGGLVESVHRVSLAVVDADGRLVAAAGNPEQVTFIRSAAKPFQALPVVEDGAAAHFGVTEEELALICSSHNSEPRQVAIVRGLLERIGATEADLACGPHRPLAADYTLPTPAARQEGQERQERQKGQEGQAERAGAGRSERPGSLWLNGRLTSNWSG